MDCDCTFAEPVHVKSRAAQSGASPQHDNFSSGFRSAAGNMAIQRQARENAAETDSRTNDPATDGIHSHAQLLDRSTRDLMKPSTGRNLSPAVIQAKPVTNTPGDAHEQAADQAAEKVVGTAQPRASAVTAHPAAAAGAPAAAAGTHAATVGAPAAPADIDHATVGTHSATVGTPHATAGTRSAAGGTPPTPPGVGKPPGGPPDIPREAACVTENLEEENRRSYSSPGRATVRSSPAPAAFSLYNYANDEPVPKPTHIQEVRLVGPLLAKYRIAVTVLGRASCPGSAAHNLELSQDRADIMADYLKEVHVQVREAKGVGESQPVADNSTAEGRSRNRAVDIIPVNIPSFHFPSLCEILPFLCRKHKNPCETNPALCRVPNFCEWIPSLCEPNVCEWFPRVCLCEMFPSFCDDDDNRTFCERHTIICGLLHACEHHPLICTLLPVCLAAPELCLPCIEDPALCVGILKCILNPASCISPPGPDEPTKPPGAVSVLFTRVRASNTPAGANDRIPDMGATSVAAIVSGWQPSMAPIRITADGTGPVNGEVLINGATEISISGSTVLQVQGISQTSPTAPVLPLSLRATMGPTPVGQSAPFAVADLMANMAIDLDHAIFPDPSLGDVLAGAYKGVRIVQGDNFAGMAVRMSWDSDGAQGLQSLDAIQLTGIFHVVSSTGVLKPLEPKGSAAGNQPVPFVTGEGLPILGPGRRETELLWVLGDARSHSTVAMKNSGYKIQEVVEPDPQRNGCLRLLLSQTGNAGHIGGFQSNAGEGAANVIIPLECSGKREIRESPLTAATARTVPQLLPELDQVHHRDGTVTLNSGASNTVGLDMMTRFLTFLNAPNGSEDTENAQLNIYGFGKLPTRSAFRKPGDPPTVRPSGYRATQEYIKGHLLNAQLGGPAEDRNLFPITGQANNDHKLEVEKDVKDLVLIQGLVANYGVRVDGQTGPYNIDVLGDGTCTYEYLNADFQCTYGTYTLYTDNTVEPLSITNKPIHSRFDLSGFISGVRGKNCGEK